MLTYRIRELTSDAVGVTKELQGEVTKALAILNGREGEEPQDLGVRVDELELAVSTLHAAIRNWHLAASLYDELHAKTDSGRSEVYGLGGRVRGTRSC